MSTVPTPFIDSHVHLADAAFESDVDEVITRARAEGARALVCIGESPDAARRARAIAARYPGVVFHTAGLHPHSAAEWDDARDPDLIREAVSLGAVAVGECGLDYHYDHAPRDVQRRVLLQQLALAAQLARPIVLHTREAEDDTMAMLREARQAGVTGVLHCFTGTHALADAGLEAGWHVSFSGVITFRKWTDDAILRRIPPDRVLVESDAPYLAPVPHRGKRNESAWVALTLHRLAAARNVDPAALGRAVMRNTCQLFGLPDMTTDSDASPSLDPHR